MHRIGATSLIALVVLAGCSGVDRFDVQWSDVVVADDRRSIDVTSYEGPFCAQDPDGVGIEIGADEIVVWSWLHDEDGADECTAECGMVTQQLELDEPLPDLPIVQRGRAYLGCGS